MCLHLYIGEYIGEQLQRMAYVYTHNTHKMSPSCMYVVYSYERYLRLMMNFQQGVDPLSGCCIILVHNPN